jgi:hypothetical protein
LPGTISNIIEQAPILSSEHMYPCTTDKYDSLNWPLQADDLSDVPHEMLWRVSRSATAVNKRLHNSSFFSKNILAIILHKEKVGAPK